MKYLPKVSAALVAALALAFLCAPARARAGNVSYEGKAKGFVFISGEGAEDGDLFESFKDVLPGDSRTQQIELQNNSSEKKPVVIYMRALGAQSGSEKFLNQLQLTVRLGKRTIFESSADNQMSSWIPLAILPYGQSCKLDLTLAVPIEVGNEFQDSEGKLSWAFKVEEAENPDGGGGGTGGNSGTRTSSSSLAKTSDLPTAPIALIATLGATAVLLGAARKRRG